MTAKADIYNLALALIGAPAISDPAGPGNAAKITAVYDIIRKSLLESHPWNFAIKRVALAQEVTTPESQYTYQYALPSDYIRTVKIYNLDSGWAEEENKILTNETEIDLIYVADITDATAMSSMFIQVLAHDLAIAIGYIITQNAAIVNNLQAARERVFSRAKAVDGQKTSKKYLYKDVVTLSMNTPYGITDEQD